MGTRPNIRTDKLSSKLSYRYDIEALRLLVLYHLSREGNVKDAVNYMGYGLGREYGEHELMMY